MVSILGNHSIMSKYRKALILVLTYLILSGCSQSSKDECFDKASHLWNKAIDNNRYEGNEQYWNAMSACEDKDK